MNFYQENFHTHLDYCRHATGRAVDYIASAKQTGLTALGFSDHTPFANDHPHAFRMRYDQLTTYRNEVIEAKRDAPMAIFLGLELDIERELDQFYDTLLNQYPFDYLIGSVHSFNINSDRIYTMDIQNNEQALCYMHLLIDAVKSRRYSFIGHPDRFFYSSYVAKNLKKFEALWLEFCQAALKHDCPIELNTSNDYTYFYGNQSPLLGYWRIAGQTGVKVVINSDAHDPLVINRHFDIAYPLAHQLGLNVISFANHLKGNLS